MYISSFRTQKNLTVKNVNVYIYKQTPKQKVTVASARCLTCTSHCSMDVSTTIITVLHVRLLDTFIFQWIFILIKVELVLSIYHWQV